MPVHGGPSGSLSHTMEVGTWSVATGKLDTMVRANLKTMLYGLGVSTMYNCLIWILFFKKHNSNRATLKCKKEVAFNRGEENILTFARFPIFQAVVWRVIIADP